jgi:hypothetical protein
MTSEAPGTEEHGSDGLAALVAAVLMAIVPLMHPGRQDAPGAGQQAAATDSGWVPVEVQKEAAGAAVAAVRAAGAAAKAGIAALPADAAGFSRARRSSKVRK